MKMRFRLEGGFVASSIAKSEGAGASDVCRRGSMMHGVRGLPSVALDLPSCEFKQTGEERDDDDDDACSVAEPEGSAFVTIG